MKSIEVQGLQKSFENKIIFNNINFSLENGEILVINGVSGSGKSTLLNILSGLIDYDQGEIYFNQQKINPYQDHQILWSKLITFIFQNFGLVETETVKENLQLASNQGKIKKNKLIECLKKVNLDPSILNQKIHTLSGGEQQRVALARVFLRDTPFVFADEPTGNLDLQNRDIILNIFKELASEKKTIIIVSHDKEVINWAGQKLCLEK